jgi:hypothetical protein
LLSRERLEPSTNGVKLLRHSRLAVCARAQEINAGERLPNCARMIVEEILAHAELGAVPARVRTRNINKMNGLDRKFCIAPMMECSSCRKITLNINCL